ncbi:MAG: JAB domain-containing protein [Eubacterium sp.]|jgi:hypothetical protein
MKNELKEVSIRIKLVEGGMFGNVLIETPEDAILAMRNLLCDLDREYVMVLNLNNQGMPINYNLVSIGSIKSSVVPISNVFKSAILANASSVLVMHNHPSGMVEPSREDNIVTERMIDAGALMEIPVLDHIIVGNNANDFFSYRKWKSEMFTETDEENKRWKTLISMSNHKEKQEGKKYVRTR